MKLVYLQLKSYLYKKLIPNSSNTDTLVLKVGRSPSQNDQLEVRLKNQLYLQLGPLTWWANNC